MTFHLFQPWVVSDMSHFGCGSFWPGHFDLGCFGLILGWVVSSYFDGSFLPLTRRFPPSRFLPSPLASIFNPSRFAPRTLVVWPPIPHFLPSGFAPIFLKIIYLSYIAKWMDGWTERQADWMNGQGSVPLPQDTESFPRMLQLQDRYLYSYVK